MTPGCMHSIVRRRSSSGDVLEQRRFLLSLHACLKIMTPKSKQNYVRCIIERAREFMESSRKKIIIKMRELEKERVRELLESSGSKEKKRKKKKKRMDKRKGKE